MGENIKYSTPKTNPTKRTRSDSIRFDSRTKPGSKREKFKIKRSKKTKTQIKSN